MTGIALDTALVHGARAGDLDALFKAWRMDEITIQLPGMAGFASAPSLGNKLRGALGRVMLQSASAAVRDRKPCEWPHTSSAEIFFGRRPLIRLGDHDSEISRPFVLSARAAADGSLVITMRIFGLARTRTSVAADALTNALGDRTAWQKMARDTGSFVPGRILPASVEVADVRIAPQSDAPSCGNSSVEMIFATPIDADRGNVAAMPGMLLKRLMRRIALVAPWQGISLVECFGSLAATAQGAKVDLAEATSAPAPERGGHHGANRLAPPQHLSIRDPHPALLQALQLGIHTHVGRGASLGLGRYRLESVPSMAPQGF